eukprot:364271-Chlamydomonas_euryale.AAC.11
MAAAMAAAPARAACGLLRRAATAEPCWSAAVGSVAWRRARAWADEAAAAACPRCRRRLQLMHG